MAKFCFPSRNSDTTQRMTEVGHKFEYSRLEMTETKVEAVRRAITTKP